MSWHPLNLRKRSRSKAGSAPGAIRRASPSSNSTTAPASPTSRWSSMPAPRAPNISPNSPPAPRRWSRASWSRRPPQGQKWELRATRVELVGPADATYPLQKKGHTPEFLRTIAHLRPRSNLFGAVFRMRSRLAFAVHQFFQERDFVYVHTPIITASDCEGAGEMFRVTTLKGEHRREAGGGFLRQARLPDRQRPARGRDLRLRAVQHLHLRPDLPRRELQHRAPRRRVLDDRAGDGLLRSRRATWTWPRSSSKPWPATRWSTAPRTSRSSTSSWTRACTSG